MAIYGKYLSTKENLDDIKSIYHRFFEKEKEVNRDAAYVVVYSDIENKNPVAIGSILYNGDWCKIEQIYVTEESRGRGFGDFVLRMLLSKAFETGVLEVSAVVPKKAVGFFETIGFEVHKMESSRVKSNLMVIQRKQLQKPCSIKNNIR